VALAVISNDDVLGNEADTTGIGEVDTGTNQLLDIDEEDACKGNDLEATVVVLAPAETGMHVTLVDTVLEAVTLLALAEAVSITSPTVVRPTAAF